MNIKLLTSGCCTDNALRDRVTTALTSTDIEASVEEIDDLEEVMSYHVMSTPALVIDGDVQVAGRTPSVDEIETLLVAS